MFGLVIGIDYFVVFCADALGLWYGAKLIRTEGYSIGQALMVRICIFINRFQLMIICTHNKTQEEKKLFE